jgi:hypothetical protein
MGLRNVVDSLVVIVITVDVCSLFFARRGESYLVTLVDGMEKCARHIEWKRELDLGILTRCHSHMAVGS